MHLAFGSNIINCCTRIHVDDLAGRPLPELADRLAKHASRSKYLMDVKPTETYVVIPNHLVDRLRRIADGLNIDHVRTVRALHVGLETDFPIDGDWLAETLADGDVFGLPLQMFYRLADFSLGIYK